MKIDKSFKSICFLYPKLTKVFNVSAGIKPSHRSINLLNDNNTHN
jgi:hypothetical protein